MTFFLNNFFLFCLRRYENINFLFFIYLPPHRTKLATGCVKRIQTKYWEEEKSKIVIKKRRKISWVNELMIALETVYSACLFIRVQLWNFQDQIKPKLRNARKFVCEKQNESRKFVKIIQNRWHCTVQCITQLYTGCVEESVV